MVKYNDERKDGENIARRLCEVFDSIDRAARRVGREPDSVRLVVVTKTVPVGRIALAIDAGARHIGENRLQEALPKIAELGQRYHDLQWHFVGRLQRRKVRSVVGTFEMIHSVDRPELAGEINHRAAESGFKQKVLLEVNLGKESSKAGFHPSELQEKVSALDALPYLQVEGLMTIPPYSKDVEAARPYFRQLCELSRTLARLPLERIRMNELSMGMSQDFPIAVEEGATLVRVGTAIFGARDV